MTVRGTLKGHSGWVTQIATTPQYPDMILSASRGEAPPGRLSQHGEDNSPPAARLREPHIVTTCFGEIC